MRLLRFFRRHPWTVFCCSILLIVLAVHGSSLRYTFVSDDYDWLTQSEANLRQHQIDAPLWHPIGGNFYRPLPALSFTLDTALAGRNAALFHADQLFTFSLLVIAIAWMIDELFHRRRLAFGVALLFAVYPSHHEVVSWLAGRPDLLAALWMVTSCVFILRFSRTRSKSDFAFLSFATAAAYMSKESALILPALQGGALLLRRLQEKTPTWRHIILGLTPSIILLAALLLIRSRVLTDAIGGYQSAGQAVGLHIQLRDLLSPITSLFSLLNLDLIRSRLPLSGITFFISHIRWLSLSAAGGLLCGFLFFVRKKRTPRSHLLPVLFGIFWAYAAFIPGLGLSSAIGSNLEGSRLFFTPSIGYCLLIVGGLYALMPHRHRWATWSMLLVSIFFATGSIVNAQPWREASATVIRITDLFRQEKAHLVRADDTDILVGGLPGKIFGAYAFWGPHIDRAILQTEIGAPLNVVVTGVTPFMTSPFCTASGQQKVAFLHWNTDRQIWEREQDTMDEVRRQQQSAIPLVLHPSDASWNIITAPGKVITDTSSAFDSQSTHLQFSVPADFFGARYRQLRVNLQRTTKLTGYGSRQVALSWQVSPTTERQTLSYTLQPEDQTFTIPLCQYPNWVLAHGPLTFDLYPGHSGAVTVTSIELLP